MYCTICAHVFLHRFFVKVKILRLLSDRPGVAMKYHVFAYFSLSYVCAKYTSCVGIYAIPKINTLHYLSCCETRFRLLCF